MAHHPKQTSAEHFLTGSQSACKAACDAFKMAVENVAENPLQY